MIPWQHFFAFQKISLTNPKQYQFSNQPSTQQLQGFLSSGFKMNSLSLKSNHSQDSWARCLHFKPIKTYQKIRESSSWGILLAETVWGWWHESWSFLQIKSVSKFVRFTPSEPPIIIIDIAVTRWITYLFLSQRISVVTKWQATVQLVRRCYFISEFRTSITRHCHFYTFVVSYVRLPEHTIEQFSSCRKSKANTRFAACYICNHRYVSQ